MALTAPTTESTQTREATRSTWKLPLWLTGPGLLLPAIIVTALFAIVPLVYLIIVSLTDESTFFFKHTIYTLNNYVTIWNRYLPHVETTIQLAFLASVLDLIFGYPFAYILIRRVHYRELVRTLMVFPLFGPLYLSFGLHYVLLPTGPLGPTLDYLGIQATTLLYSFWTVIFGMAVFTFPFMVMNIGTALANVDPMLEEAATTLGAKPWQIFWRVLFPLSRSGILAGFLMCFGWNLGVFVVPILLGTTKEQRALSIMIQLKGLAQFDYGLAAAMGIVLMALVFVVTWLSLKLSKGALGA